MTANHVPPSLAPVTVFEGPQLAFGFPALRVGVAEYEEGPTGCTVFWFPASEVAWDAVLSAARHAESA